MENKIISLANRPKASDDGYIPSCMLWIFGNDNSAENDLLNKFEIVNG